MDVSKKIFVLILLILIISNSYAQRSEGKGNGTIKGIVKGEHGELVEYATITLFSKKDSALVTGSISKQDGSFEIADLAIGRYYAEVSFVGFDKTIITDITIRPPNLVVDIKEVRILPSAESIGEVEVIANKPHVEYKIDKKVVSVTEDLVATGATAVEVLENVPSIQTDIEGNISVRGSSNFTVYIDGRPSILDGSDALQQIPASAIDNIEIITNPSAKYEAEGTGGIINVVMKKRRGQGLNGIVNASIGTNGKYGTDLLLNYRSNAFNVYGGIDYNKRNYSMESSSYERRWDTVFLNDAMTAFRIDTSFKWNKSEIENDRNGMGFKLGIDYSINEMNTFSISGEYDMRNRNRNSFTWRDEELNGIESGFYTEGFSRRASDNYKLNMDYKSKFNENGHQISASLNLEGEAPGSGRDEGLREFRQPNLAAPVISYNNGDVNPEYEIRFKTDYVNPFSEYGKVEAGLQYDGELAHYDYYFQEFDPDLNAWENIDSLSQILDINVNVYSAYGLYSNKIFWDVDVQGGLRMEYTDRIVKADQDYIIQRPDLFPSLHISKVFNDQNQLMMGYSRRIRRPREWHLNPVRRYWDTENIRQGNPQLEPEYANMYEINYQFSKERSFIAFELYHRHEINMMERIIETLNDSINLQRSINAGERFSTGAEIMGNLVVKKALTINGSFSVFNDRIDSPERSEELDNEQFSWRARLNTTINTPWKGRAQINGFYRAAGITSQGERGGFFVLNAGYRQDFFDRKLTATIQARDILQSMNYTSISYLDNRIIDRQFKRESPIVTLTLSYKINNYKNREKNGQNRGENNGGMDGGGDDDMF